MITDSDQLCSRDQHVCISEVPLRSTAVTTMQVNDLEAMSSL